jgi:prepilin-type processing-associated H-X9-DG protein
MGLFAPLWQETEAMVWNVSLADAFRLDGTVFANDAEAAGQVADTLSAVVTLNRNGVHHLAERSVQWPEAAFARPFLQVAEQMLAAFEFRRDGSRVLVTSAWDAKQTAAMTALLMPGIREARLVNRRTRSKNNLKQIGIAMHNFHDVNRRFPAPSELGKDGKTRHSWRVALLPFVDEGDLYNQYRFDEPWDSEHNKTLLDQMPAVYRHPADEADSTHASYFAFTGDKTALGPKEGQGVGIRHVTDGTSNTLLVVEAKKKIPWTKPEDVEYDPKAEKPPEFGGWSDDGAHVLFCDGSVRLLPKSVTLDNLRLLIERNDNQPVNHEEIFGPR